MHHLYPLAEGERNVNSITDLLPISRFRNLSALHTSAFVVRSTHRERGPTTVCSPRQPRHVRATVTANDTGRNNSEAPQVQIDTPSHNCRWDGTYG